MYQYQIKKGEENRVFAGDGVRNLGNGVVESDHELESPYLTSVTAEEHKPQQMTTTPDLPTPSEVTATQTEGV